MNRRLFTGQLSAGLALQLLPISGFAGASLLVEATKQPACQRLSKAAELVQSGLIGLPQQLTISHVYSPDRTSIPALLTLAEQDLDRAGRLLGITLTIDAPLFLAAFSSAAFGSYSIRFNQANLTVVWQALARVSHRVSAPTSMLRLFGSEGILQTATDGRSYQYVDFQGRVLPTATL